MRLCEFILHVITELTPLVPIHFTVYSQAVTDIIQHCKNELFADKSLHLQAWALVEAAGYSFVESSQKEELCVLIQCRESSQLCIIRYYAESNVHGYFLPLAKFPEM